MRFGKVTLIFPLMVLSIILCFLYYLNTVLDDKEKASNVNTLKEKRQRDYINHPVHEYYSTTPEGLITVPKLHIFRSSNKYEQPETPCVSLKTLVGRTPICIFDPSIDTMISSYVRDYGTWEQDLLNETGIVLLSKPHLTFIDIGCNIGTFTLFSAKLGVRVVALDILMSALELVEMSLLKGSLHDNVTLVFNAISDKRESVKVHRVIENPGGSYIEQNKTGGNMVDSIVLDDLLSIVREGSVFLKMDIEGNELKALKGGSKFFQLLNVEYILMEWMLHRYNPSGKDIIHFLLRNGMLPYESLSRAIPLDLARSYQWPDNIFWRKR